MPGAKVAVVRSPGQQIQFRLDWDRVMRSAPSFLRQTLERVAQHPDIDLDSNRFLRLGNRHWRIAPVREAKIMRMLQEAGVDARFVDFLCGPQGGLADDNGTLLDMRVGSDLELRFLNFGSLPLSYHREEVHRETLARLERALDGIEVVLISTTFAFENPTYALLIHALKQLGKRVVVGSSDASSSPAVYVAYGADLVFRGDFVVDDPAFVGLLAGRVPGYLARITDFRFHPPNHKLAFPQHVRSHVPPVAYVDGHDGPLPEWLRPKLDGSPVWGAMFSYGCPMGCDFCDTPQWSGLLGKRQFQYMPLSDAKAAIDELVAQGIRVLDVLDDNLLLIPRDHLRELFAHMKRRGLYWNFPNGLQISLLLRWPEGIDVLFPPTEDGNRGFNLYWPLEAIGTDGELDRGRYRKLTDLDSNIALMGELLARGVRVECAVILLERYTEQLFGNVSRVFERIGDAVDGRRQAPLRFSVYHPIPLGELRKRQIPPVVVPSRALGPHVHFDAQTQQILCHQGLKYFYSPTPIALLTHAAGEQPDLNWPSFAQAFLLGTLFEVDPTNVVRMQGAVG